MALTHGIKPIVTNGLVLCLDAGNRKSYPTTGTTWTDLSGRGNTGTLTNGPTYSSVNGGSIVFDGSNDYVQVTGSITTSTCTFIVWIYMNGGQGLYDGIIFSRSTDVVGMHFSGSNSISNRVAYTWLTQATVDWDSGLNIPNATWCMIAVSISPTSATGYLCQSSGITTATNNTTHAAATLDAIMIGRDTFSTRYMTGNIGVAQIYNRALTATEISQKYNALKSRYI